MGVWITSGSPFYRPFTPLFIRLKNQTIKGRSSFSKHLLVDKGVYWGSGRTNQRRKENGNLDGSNTIVTLIQSPLSPNYLPMQTKKGENSFVPF